MSVVLTALESLRAELADGAWPPGARLPAERSLAARMGVGRGTLRKALDALAAEGRIRRRVGEGTFVAETPAATMVFDAAPSPADVMEARRIVEPAVARAAALRARPAEIEAMRLLAAPVAADGEAAAWRAWEARDAAFHEAVAAASGNPLLGALLRTLNAMRDDAGWSRLRRAALSPEHRLAHASQHAAVAEAVAARDPAAAAEAMRAHLTAVEAAMDGEPAETGGDVR